MKYTQAVAMNAKSLDYIRFYAAGLQVSVNKPFPTLVLNLFLADSLCLHCF